MTHALRIVFDLDGTLADCTHRLHFLETRPKDWDGFNAACHLDPPHGPVVALYRALHRSGVSVCILTGRSEDQRAKTRLWLQKHDLVGALFMRPVGDHREDAELKREWLGRERARGCTPDLVFEDRARVVQMWRDEGIHCMQVAPGDF